MNIYRHNDYDYIFKLVLLGDSGVGKTNILSKYISKEFDKNSKATVGVEFGSKEFEIDNNIIKVQIWDTAGQERYQSITKNFYQGAKGFIFVYDITKPSSFDNIEKWIESIETYVEDDNISKILIGNKSDLESQRNITTEKGIEKAKTLEMAFIETSALNGNNINEAFANLIKDAYKKNKKEIQNNKKMLSKEGKNLSKLNNGEFKPTFECCGKTIF